jgi:hypothetical protein
VQNLRRADWFEFCTRLVRGIRRPGLTAAEVKDCFTIHCFSRAFSNLMRQVASGEVVRSVTGHVTERMTEH